MTTLTEKRHAGEFIVSEANGMRSREGITVKSGQDLDAGQILSLAVAGAGSGAADAGNTGDGAIGAIVVAAGTKVGIYKVTLIEPGTDVGDFVVEDPDGVNVGTGVIADAFTGGGITFTIADGAADFIAGDQFDITIAAGSGEYEAFDGTEPAVGILFDAVDATAAALPGVALVRDSEVNGGEIDWNGEAAGVISAGTEDLQQRGIIIR